MLYLISVNLNTMYNNNQDQDQLYDNDLFINKILPANIMDLSFQSTPVNVSSLSNSPDLQFSCQDFNETTIDSLSIQEEYQKDDFLPPSLDELLCQFPDLPSFINHHDFQMFSNIWFEFQKNIMIAREPSHRLFVQTWLESTALQIHFMMVTIVNANTPIIKENVEASPRRMFSALRRLKDRIEIMHQVFQIIENGRVSFGQSPSEAIEPLIEAAMKIKRDVSYLSNFSEKIPIIRKDKVNLANPDNVTMNEISNTVMDTYNLMPYNNSITTAANNLISVPSLQQDFTPFTHIQPAWIHQTSSLPVTPSTSSNNRLNTFFSLPASPTCTHEMSSVDGTAFTPCNTIQSNSPLNTLSEFNNSDFDLEEDINIEDDDEYIISDAPEDEDYKEHKHEKRQRYYLGPRNSKGKRTNVVTKQLGIEKQFTRRTATSYDAQTTHYLKSIFFDIYSNRDKLTKDQRRQVQKETGLKPRNITYWFSNHKRRFHNSLLVFKKIIKDSNGSVKNYDDFLEWRRARGLSEEVLETEHLKILNSIDDSIDD